GGLVQRCQIRRHQKARQVPRKPDPRRDRGRRGVQPSVDVDVGLLARAVAGILRQLPAGSRFHRGENVARQPSATDRVEAQRRVRLRNRLDQLLEPPVCAGVDDVLSALRTEQAHLLRRPHTLINGISSARQMRFNMRPRFEAAAVCTMAGCPPDLATSRNDNAVNGLTNAAAPAAAGVPSGRTMHADAGTVRYSAYIPPPITATVRPSNACASGESPAATTVPAPSLPTAIGMPTLACMAAKPRSGTGAVILGPCSSLLCSARPRSAVASSRLRSDGLIGAASTRISTSSAPGARV